MKFNVSQFIMRKWIFRFEDTTGFSEYPSVDLISHPMNEMIVLSEMTALYVFPKVKEYPSPALSISVSSLILIAANLSVVPMWFISPTC